MWTPVVARMSLAAIRPRDALGPQPHHGEVGGAAADVDDQHHGFVLQAALVVERSGDRLQLEGHVGEARARRAFGQRLLRPRIALLVAVDEVHGPPDHHALRLGAQVPARPRAQFSQEAADDRLEAQHPAVDGGFLVQQAASQQAFQRAHQAAFDAREIERDRIAAEVRAAVLHVEEHRRRHARGRALQRHQPRPAVGCDEGDRGVRGAEIDPERRPLRARHRDGRFRTRGAVPGTG